MCHYLSTSVHPPSPICPGDIGGQMGLFIGASVLTILEIFDYLYEVMCFSQILIVYHSLEPNIVQLIYSYLYRYENVHRKSSKDVLQMFVIYDSC